MVNVCAISAAMAAATVNLHTVKSHQEQDKAKSDAKSQNCTQPKTSEHHVCLIRYAVLIDGATKQHMCALFDERDFTEEEVLQILETGIKNPKIVTMCIEQYENVFRSLFKK